MSEEEAKAVLRSAPDGNIWKRLEAILTAREILGKGCTATEIKAWAKGGDNVQNYQM